MPPAVELENLLREERWLRRLARRLVVDPNEADDLVQETWLAALSTRRAEGELSRNWARSVLRNVWRDLLRGRARRDRREQAAAREEATEAVDELTAELELRQQVGRCLLELDEPYRRALTLRFFREASLKGIARGEGISITTAHERVERGLAELRKRLDREHGGERRAWALGLAALARRASWTATTVEVLAMASAWKVAIGVLVLGGGLAWWWAEHPAARSKQDASPALAAKRADEAPPAARALGAVAEGAAREALAQSVAPTSPVSGSPQGAELAQVRGRVLDLTGAPVALVEVGWQDAERATATSTTAPATVKSAADGSFLLAPYPIGTGAIRCLDARYATLVPGAGADTERVVVVGPAVSFSGVVVDPSGAPIAGATLAFRLRERLFRNLGLVRPGWRWLESRWTATSDERGRFALADMAGGEGTFLDVEARGYRPRPLELAPAGAADLVITLEANPREVTYTGRVLDPTGAPVEGAQVSAGDAIVRTDAAGSFTLEWRGGNGLVVQDEHGTWREQGIEDSKLIALKPGFAPALERLIELDPAQPVVLHLGLDMQSIVGHVLDPAGAPCAGAIVWLRDPTRFGRKGETVGDEVGSHYNDLDVEELACAGSHAMGVRCDAEGRFELDCLLERDYQLLAYDARSATRGGPWTISAGESDAHLVLAPEPGTTRVAGRLVTPGGEPLAGAEIQPLRGGTRDLAGLAATRHEQPPELGGDTLALHTDAEGRFAFESLVAPGTGLQIFHQHTFFRFVQLDDFHDLEHLELVEPVLCELQVDLSREPEFADTLKVLDERGKELEMLESSANVVAMLPSADLRAGLSAVLRVPETARTLVLYKKELEVLRKPLQLDPDKRTTLAP